MAMFSVTTQYFEKTVLGADAPVLVEFTAPWCGYCRRLAPVLQRMSAEAGMPPIATVNIDEEPALAEQFRVDTIPTLLLFQKGGHGTPLVAPSTAAQIKDWLAGQEV